MVSPFQVPSISSVSRRVLHHSPHCKLKLLADNPSGAECYGLSASAMVSWIRDFSNTYHSSTGVYVVSSLSSCDLLNQFSLQLSRSVAEGC